MTGFWHGLIESAVPRGLSIFTSVTLYSLAGTAYLFTAWVEPFVPVLAGKILNLGWFVLLIMATMQIASPMLINPIKYVGKHLIKTCNLKSWRRHTQ